MKNMCFFGLFAPKTKNSVKPKNPKKNQAKPKILSQILFFGFLVSGGFAESQHCGKQVSTTNGCM